MKAYWHALSFPTIVALSLLIFLFFCPWSGAVFPYHRSLSYTVLWGRVLLHRPYIFRKSHAKHGGGETLESLAVKPMRRDKKQIKHLRLRLRLSAPSNTWFAWRRSIGSDLKAEPGSKIGALAGSYYNSVINLCKVESLQSPSRAGNWVPLEAYSASKISLKVIKTLSWGPSLLTRLGVTFMQTCGTIWFSSPAAMWFPACCLMFPRWYFQMDETQFPEPKCEQNWNCIN